MTSRSARAAALATAASLLIAGRAGAYSSGPPDGFAGDPPFFRTCSNCHGDGVPGDGSLELLNTPLQFTPGQVYALTVRLRDPGQMRWGFELTAIEDATLFQSGTLSVTDMLNTQLSDNPGTQPDYLKHTFDGTYSGVLNGPVTWNFQWTAPLSGGSLTFYLAGNAANGNGIPDLGDEIYAIQVPVSPTVGIEPVASPSIVTALEPSFPNPFRPSTTIPFTLAESGPVRLSVYGADGRLIAQLIEGEQAAGRHIVSWDGRDRNGQRLPSGVYFFALNAGGVESRQRAVLAE